MFFDIRVKKFTISIFILEILLGKFIISLPRGIKLSLYIVESGLLDGGMEMFCSLKSFRKLTDIIEIHPIK